jgi:hypothetical protein
VHFFFKVCLIEFILYESNINFKPQTLK